MSATKSACHGLLGALLGLLHSFPPPNASSSVCLTGYRLAQFLVTRLTYNLPEFSQRARIEEGMSANPPKSARECVLGALF